VACVCGVCAALHWCWAVTWSVNAGVMSCGGGAGECVADANDYHAAASAGAQAERHANDG